MTLIRNTYKNLCSKTVSLIEIVIVDQISRQIYNCLYEAHVKYKNTCRLKVNGWTKISYANTNLKKRKWE